MYDLIERPILMFIGLVLVIIGFILIVSGLEIRNDGFIYIFPFIFIDEADPLIMMLLILLFIIPFILLILMSVRFK